jgi:hypothetical protein
MNEKRPANRVALDPGSAAAIRWIHFVETRPREFDNGSTIALRDAIVDRRTDGDQLHFAPTVAPKRDVSRNDKVECFLIPQLRLSDPPAAFDQLLTLGIARSTRDRVGYASNGTRRTNRATAQDP